MKSKGMGDMRTCTVPPMNPSTLQQCTPSYRFEFLPVDLAAVKQQGCDGVACPGRLHRGWGHIQKVLESAHTRY